MNPGKYISVTCNIGFNPNNSYADTIEVDNFYGDSITVKDQPTGKWDSFGTAKVPGSLIFERDESEWKVESYKTVNTDTNESQQNCAVWANIWS